ncbi:MAG: rhodanese-like domain-containing protein [Deltaproteobacteria bacterium]|nr:rhodanese-like domain-containing protein [Deltaproteobacteria bacterium]
MIDTFFMNGQLNEATGFLVALAIGILFGFILEQVGFGSSKKLSGVFYFRDMVVFKFMASALTTAAVGMGILWSLGRMGPENTYVLPTVWGAYVVGGVLFGVGFAMSGWCPGTGAVGLASGKYDAGVFIGGVLIGSIVFNELYPVIAPLYTWGDQGVVYLHESLGISRHGALVLVAIIAVATIGVSEWIERRDISKPAPAHIGARILSIWQVTRETARADRGFLIFLTGIGAFTLVLLMVTKDYTSEQAMLKKIAAGEDHIEPDVLARRMLKANTNLLVVDIRPKEEYEAFHLKGAINVELPNLPGVLARQPRDMDIVLYSNGMTHPAQARDALERAGFDNVYLLTDGLNGFIDRCLTPVSLRSEPVPAPLATEIRLWRQHFLLAALTK